MQFNRMKRRELITLIGGVAAAWPIAARAQRAAIPVIGSLHSASDKGTEHFMDAFRQGLKEAGFVEGQNVRIEYRWADGAYDRLPSLTNDLLSLRVNVIVPFGTSAIRAAKVVHATSSATEIPIVFAAGNDPVADGIVASLRPGGKIFGNNEHRERVGLEEVGAIARIAPRYTNNQPPGRRVGSPARSSRIPLARDSRRSANLMTVAVAVHRDGNCGQLPFLKFICGPNATLRA